ncbi:hypothetical protein C7408_12212 [Paraburkholderia caballeronis]|uniref:Uncharacterized protein n=1 Tax=Paraburkholderia caballeronis TaxID=416943 RepID=A0A1H7TP71_9BURK|nr:hypothetical protein C7403_11712 [Paraburkholderia caballeronis]PXW95320.1 hypothetical protein C7407_11712 [Paraburkholderia caballeronis]RAJ91134.1 hypothetical protein C7409_11712 [Paraburkholderia caballeronis]TDV06753.1 hypothetical protein C7408_12212 [Paraburkholderia caballeronis]TDV09933.1 hypothetical protein C7406_12412 [Paraburkholderia caballeronis]
MIASFLLLVVAAGFLGHTAMTRAKLRASLQPVRVRADRPRRFR